MKQTLAIIFGGASSEYKVSLQSAAAVAGAVDANDYDLVLLGITAAGQWLYYNGPIEQIEEDTWWKHSSCAAAFLSPSREDHGVWVVQQDNIEKKTLDLAFPVLHGKNGEDGTVQGLLQLAGIPCVGSGTLASALCMDKDAAHRLAQQEGVLCPAYILVEKREKTAQEIEQEVLQGMQDTPLPWFVKPVSEGSSFGVTKVEDYSQLAAALQHAFKYTKRIVVEQGIEGIEIGCAILGNDELITGVPDAIALQQGFFDYHEKYTLETARILLPAPVAPQILENAKDTAKRLYRLFGCKGFARVDLFCTKEGTLLFNEVNTIPGLTLHSRYPGMMNAAQVPFKQMIQRLLELAVEE
ncbi:MAG: D-alanine--D-alanine ligase [Oscillospiraceae bacterium]